MSAPDDRPAGRDRLRLLVVEHEADAPLALLEAWLVEAGVRPRVCRPWAGEELPTDPTTCDGLLVLGGSAGALDDDEVAYLAPLKELLRAAVAAEVPVLGVCLGHQLLAAALGGDVVPSPAGQRVGVHAVGWLPEAATDPLAGPLVGTTDVGVHWNNDVVVTLPPGAVALARTPEGDLQVARFAPMAWGVQLHPEVDRPVVAAWVGGDAAGYRARGIDPEAALAEVDAARAALDSAWAPLAAGFARQMDAGRVRRGA